MENIISKFIELRKKFNLNFDDKTLFEQAIDLYISMGIQKGYGDNVGKTEINDSGTIETSNSSNKKETTEKKKFGKPTEKMRYVLDKVWNTQDGKEFLKEIGFDGNFELLNFSKAKELISQVKKKQEES